MAIRWFIRKIIFLYYLQYTSCIKKPLGTSIYYYDLKTGKEVGVAGSNPIDGSYKKITYWFFL